MTRVLAVDLLWTLIGDVGCFERTNGLPAIGESFVEFTNNYWLYSDYACMACCGSGSRTRLNAAVIRIRFLTGGIGTSVGADLRVCLGRTRRCAPTQVYVTSWNERWHTRTLDRGTWPR
jgi:hypothetical protein